MSDAIMSFWFGAIGAGAFGLVVGHYLGYRGAMRWVTRHDEAVRADLLPETSLSLQGGEVTELRKTT